METVLEQPLQQTKTRIGSIDVLRGVVMVIMALDHARELLHVNGFYYDPTDLATTTPFLFFTRWITHFCAPVFVFLAGTSAYLSGRRKTQGQLSRFLLTRGTWLILLELTVVNFGIWFDPSFSTILLQVIWAIGVSMVVLSGLVFLPYRVLLGIGWVIVVGHNALDGISFPPGSMAQFIWSLLHQSNFVPLSSTRNLIIGYPVLPWIGVMVLGYCLGKIFTPEFTPERRKRILFRLGGVAVVSFMLLRAVNIYGDLRPWSEQKDGVFTLLSFLNTTKYPPSLLYLLMTLGPALLLLYALEGKANQITRFFKVYGQVPLFYYILHFYLIHSLSVANLLANGIAWSEINFSKLPSIPPDTGFSLGAVYSWWLLIVLVLYPLCRWYGKFKVRQKGMIWGYL